MHGAEKKEEERVPTGAFRAVSIISRLALLVFVRKLPRLPKRFVDVADGGPPFHSEKPVGWVDDSLKVKIHRFFHRAPI